LRAGDQWLASFSLLAFTSLGVLHQRLLAGLGSRRFRCGQRPGRWSAPEAETPENDAQALPCGKSVPRPGVLEPGDRPASVCCWWVLWRSSAMGLRRRTSVNHPAERRLELPERVPTREGCRGAGAHLCCCAGPMGSAAARRVVLKRVRWVDWPCVPGRRPRPNGIDAPSNAREMRDRGKQSSTRRALSS
jgi:hypothetical protein